MKTRHLCAILGAAIAVGAVTFMQSLVATNDYQARAIADALVRAVPVAAKAEMASFAVDYRPNERVMQGPPLMAVTATQEGVEGVVVTKALFASRRLACPAVGTVLTFVGRNGAYKLPITKILEWEKPIGRGASYPNAFVSPETAKTIGEEWSAFKEPARDELAATFKSDAGRNFDRAKSLLLWAAALTALCLLVNSLFLSIEAKRKEIAILRMMGLTRMGVIKKVTLEAMMLTASGLLAGVPGGLVALAAYVTTDTATYPSGLAVAWWQILFFLPIAFLVAIIAALIALKPALAVKPLEAASNCQPRKKHLGMLIAFACGFGAFVAVEVWGGSLMRAFVPSPEWPDAIVSILPNGVSSFEIDRIRKEVKGVKRVHELAPLQVNLLPLEELKGYGGKKKSSMNQSRRRQYRNALLLGSDWLPNFRFAAGNRESAEAAICTGDNCIITEMMARAQQLKSGDLLQLDCGRGLTVSLKIVGIVDLNWHMVTSRGLVRGLNRMPVNTDGPVFVSFDTIEACDLRPSSMVKMTHLWLDYEKDFLARHGVFEAGRIVEKNIVRILEVATPQPTTNTIRLHTRDEVADGTLAHGANLIGAMARVPFIFILVISLGFVAMLVASAEARKREFLVMRAVGATRVQMARVLIEEALKVAGWGLVIGFTGGALVGWLCTAGTRAAMANWGLPASFDVPVVTIINGALGAILFALVVAVPTSLAIIRHAIRR